MRIFLVFFLLLPSSLAFAGVEQISESEFRALAGEIAHKVNLFHTTWAKDPNAEFYGGTTRDYLYWLKGQFREAKNHSEAEAIAKNLRAVPAIDVRDFIIGDSDVDIIGTSSTDIRAEDFGVRKIDFQSTDILDHSTLLGQNEVLQGYIPAEKIRLSREGLKPTLGDGVAEIYHGKLSVHFASAEDFAKSKYAQEGINHPILLALRYIRLQAINYFRSHGAEYPKLDLLFHEGMTPESAGAVRRVIEEALAPGALKPYLERSKFKSWINGGIQKAFRSYTNPTAALELMKAFKVNILPTLYPDEIETLNQYVFNKYRDLKEVKDNLKKYAVNEEEFFTPPASYFTDGKLYHGTRTEPAFRGILFQGVLPSEGGFAGPGLYGVAANDKQFSENWAGDKNRLLSFDVDPKAKVVDVTKGEGAKIWQLSEAAHHNNYEKFSDLFGVDIVRYPYDTQAFVVENASVLSGAQGVHRTMMSLSQLIAAAKNVSDPGIILDWFSVNQISTAEEDMIWRASRVTGADLAHYLKGLDDKAYDRFVKIVGNAYCLEKPELRAVVINWINGRGWPRDLAAQTIGKYPDLFTEGEIPAVLEQAFSKDILIMTSETRRAILSYVTHRKIFSELFRNSALQIVDSNRPREEDFDAALKYLDTVPLREGEAARLLKMLQQNKFRDLADAQRRAAVDADRKVAEILLSQGRFRQEIYDRYARKLAAPLTRKSYDLTVLERWQDAIFLRKKFPGDQATKDLTGTVFADIIHKISGNGLPGLFYNEVLSAAGDDPHIKQALLDKLSGTSLGGVADSIYALERIPLNNAEVLQVLNADLSGKFIAAGALASVNKIPSPLPVDLQYALVRGALKYPEIRDLFFSSMRLPENEPAIHAYVEQLVDQLLRGENIVGIKFTGDSVTAMLQFLAEAPLEHTAGLDEKALQLVEQYYQPNSPRSASIREVLAGLRSTEPSIPGRVEALLLKDTFYLDSPHTLYGLLHQIPNPSPKLRELVEASLQNVGGTEQNAEFKDQLAMVRQYLKNTNPGANPHSECAGNFAQLVP